MKNLSRPQIHAYALTALAVLIIALGVALDMLGHATMSGGPQWSGGALGGACFLLFIAFFVALIVAATAFGEAFERYRVGRKARKSRAFADGWATRGAPYRPAHWAQQAADEVVYELGDEPEPAPEPARRRHALTR